ncbi:MAG: glycosyltransferase [Planctomycetota bacterium]
MKIGLDLSALESARRTGVERYALQLGTALDADPLHAVYGYSRRTLCPAPPFPCHRVSSSLPRPWWRSLRLAYAARAEGIQHLHAPTSAAIPSRGFTRSRCVHDLGFLGTDGGGGDEAMNRWERRRRVAALSREIPTIFPSEATRREFFSRFSDWSAPSVVIPHGVEAALFDDTALPTALPAEVPEAFALVLGTCRLRRQPERLAELFREPIDGLSLVWAGGGHAPPSLRAGVPGLLFLGEVDDRTRRSLLDQAQLLIMPSRIEGFGIPALEALARRCPVLAQDLPVYEETLGDHGVRVDFSEDSAFIEGLQRARTFSAAAREAGRQHAETFTWERSAKAHAEFFAELSAS